MGKRKRVIVWGAGGHGKVVVDALLAGGCFDVVGFLDDDSGKIGHKVLGIPVLQTRGGAELADELAKLGVGAVALAIGDNYARDRKFREMREYGLALINVLHPSARISRFVELGEGVTILASATINPGTVIEDNVCVNTAAAVDHDNHLGLSCHIFPHATLTGGVRVEEFAYVGSGSVIAPNLTVRKYAYVGAGAVVLRDVPEGQIVAGVPAAVIAEQTKRPEICGSSAENGRKWRKA